jgi:glyoxylase-like metal-dependent hydrolase (beta-lactamase superfamily II)
MRRLINTHWHFDHVDGNEWLNAEGSANRRHVRRLEHRDCAAWRASSKMKGLGKKAERSQLSAKVFECT